MDIDSSGPDKGLPENGATSESDCLPPLNRHGDTKNEVDPTVRRSALKRTPIKQVEEQDVQEFEKKLEPGDCDKTPGASGGLHCLQIWNFCGL